MLCSSLLQIQIQIQLQIQFEIHIQIQISIGLHWTRRTFASVHPPLNSTPASCARQYAPSSKKKLTAFVDTNTLKNTNTNTNTNANACVHQPLTSTTHLLCSQLCLQYASSWQKFYTLVLLCKRFIQSSSLQ